MTPEKTYYNWLVRNSPIGWHWQRIENVIGRGTPDVSVGIPNQHEVWLELKSTKGAVRPEQRAWMLRRLAAGGRCLILRRAGTLPVNGTITIPDHKQDIVIRYSGPIDLFSRIHRYSI